MKFPSTGSIPCSIPGELLRNGALLGTVWLALWLGGCPRPNVDDGFFAGAGIHLAETGRLENPWIRGWMGWLPGSQADKFLLQPPLYPLVLAGWLKVVGVSTATLTGYGCVVGFGASLTVWALLRRLSASVAAAWLAAALVGAWLLSRGLRPESLALLFASGGQLCLLSHRHPLGWLGGGLLGSAAVLAHPIWVIIVAPATVLQILKSRPGPPRSGLLAALAGGIGLSAILLVAGLGSDFRPFLHDLTSHARFVAPTENRLDVFFQHFQVGYDYYRNLLVVGLSLVCLLLNGSAAWAAALTWLGVQLLGFVLYTAQSTMFLVLLAALVPLLLGHRHLGWRRRLHLVPALILLVAFGGQHSLQWLADRQQDSRPLRTSTLAYLAAASPAQMIFDATTLRTVFDFRPPAGAVDLAWAWSPGRDDRWWSPDHLDPTDCWVINPVWSHRQLPHEAARNRFVLMGRPFASVRSSRVWLLVLGADLPAPRDLPFIASPRP